MFITPHGKEDLQAQAAKIGCKFGEVISGNSFKVALAGNTFAVKDQLKAAGFRFDGQNKCWTLDAGYDAMRAFLNTL